MKRNYDFSKGAVIKGKIKSKAQVEEAIKGVQKTLTSIRLVQLGGSPATRHSC